MNTSNKDKIQDYMLDTVSIKLTYPNFRITNPKFFKPALYIQQEYYFKDKHDPSGFKKYIQNTKQKTETYMPRLTAYEVSNKDGHGYNLYIEFSVPKLIFGNNLQELGDDDFEKVITTLKSRLQRMAVETTEDALRNAVVAKAHFGKNIQLPHPVTAQDAISTLYKADVGKRKDVNIRHYGNDGQALYFYTSSANIIFYDKVKDIETSKTRALDKDRIKNERFILLGANKEQKQEILRFEIRLAKQQSLDAFLSKALGEKIKAITFERIFNKNLCQRALLECWEKITTTPASQLALKIERPLGEIFDAMIKDISPTKKKQAHSLNKTLASFGLYILINNHGVRRTRNKIEKNWTDKSWKRLSEKIKISATTLKELPTTHVIKDIQSALEKFEKYDWKPD